MRSAAPLAVTLVSLAASAAHAGADIPGQYAHDGSPVIGTLLLAPDEPQPTSLVVVRERPSRDAPILHSGPGMEIRSDGDGSLVPTEFVQSLRIGAEEWQLAVYEHKGGWARVQVTEAARSGWVQVVGRTHFIPLADHFRHRSGWLVGGKRPLFEAPGSRTPATPRSHAITFAGVVRAPPMPSPLPRDAALPHRGLVRVFARPDASDDPLHHFARSNTETWIASFQDGEHLFDRAIPIFQHRGRWLQAAIPHEDEKSFPFRREKYRSVKTTPDGTRRVWLLADEVETLEPIASEDVSGKAREAVLERYFRDVEPEVSFGESREVGGRPWIHVKTSATPVHGDPLHDHVLLEEGWVPLLDENGKFTAWFVVSAC